MLIHSLNAIKLNALLYNPTQTQNIIWYICFLQMMSYQSQTTTQFVSMQTSKPGCCTLIVANAQHVSHTGQCNYQIIFILFYACLINFIKITIAMIKFQVTWKSINFHDIALRRASPNPYYDSQAFIIYTCTWLLDGTILFRQVVDLAFLLKIWISQIGLRYHNIRLYIFQSI